MSPGSIIPSLMNITVNGESREITAQTSVAALIQQLRLLPKTVAVELNKRLLRSDRYETVLCEGDSIEIVTFVGGG